MIEIGKDKKSYLRAYKSIHGVFCITTYLHNFVWFLSNFHAFTCRKYFQNVLYSPARYDIVPKQDIFKLTMRFHYCSYIYAVLAELY